MNNDIKDLTKETLQKWSTALAAAFNAAGFGCRWESHTGSSSIRLGRLIVRKNHVETDIKYHVDFERKLIVKKGTRTMITRLEVYNPVGGLHVHISNFTDEMVAKIVGYATQSIESKLARMSADAAREVRLKKGWDIYNAAMKDFPMPDWVRARPNCERDEDVGTFRLLFSDHLIDWPLARIGIEQVMALVDQLRGINCSHKFVDSLRCLKCGWMPPVDPPAPETWRPASVPVPTELVNDPNSVTGVTKMLLLCVEYNENPVRGWFYGGLLNEFRMEGCPQAIKPSHWMPLPAKPSSV